MGNIKRNVQVLKYTNIKIKKHGLSCFMLH